MISIPLPATIPKKGREESHCDLHVKHCRSPCETPVFRSPSIRGCSRPSFPSRGPCRVAMPWRCRPPSRRRLRRNKGERHQLHRFHLHTQQRRTGFASQVRTDSSSSPAFDMLCAQSPSPSQLRRSSGSSGPAPGVPPRTARRRPGWRSRPIRSLYEETISGGRSDVASFAHADLNDRRPDEVRREKRAQA